MTRPAYTNETFITRAREVHNNKYSYELVDYKTNKIKVKITCPSHGVWEQTPNHHLKGIGCKACCYEAKASTAKSEFEEKASIVHNSKYSYELVEYQNCRAKVSIVCPIHGEFLQTPNNHLNGAGCPHCALSEQGWSRTSFVDKCEKNNNGLGILYILECFNDNEHFYKIGITSRSVKERYHSKASMPYLYSIVKEVIGDPIEIYNLEIKLHQINKENHYVPSIPFGGHATECFKEYKEK